MQISNDVVASINYVLKDDNGTIIDQSNGEPLVYIHGAGNLIPGLESQLEGKAAGDKLEATVAPADGYGEIDAQHMQTVKKDMFPEDTPVEVGMQFHGADPSGSPIVVTVASIEGDEVIIDGNHELAGKTLHFSVEVLEVRAASDDELSHGHVHGPGCNH
ncbi:MAG: FKBP-type peptidyl-prolyl cis-trans isomerase SlyD [Saprospiraceae bacterium]|jgi:FKBP-type peptidyl-prolyl cis-trans isomerase SlyD